MKLRLSLCFLRVPPPRVGLPSLGGQTSGGVVNQLKRSHFLEEQPGKIHRTQ
jgi:hypothetical protein